MVECERRLQANEDELTLYDRERIPYVTYKDFIDKELVIFSYEDCQRAIPSVVDGFKPGQRKVMWSCFKRNGNQRRRRSPKSPRSKRRPNQRRRKSTTVTIRSARRRQKIRVRIPGTPILMP